MNDELTWHFNLAVIEWLLILAALVVLGFAGALLTRKYINQKQKNTSSADSDLLVKNWHSETSESVFESLEASLTGLSKDQANSRLSKYGPNKLAETKTRGPLVRFIYQFHNVLIYVLIVASAVTAMLEHWVDASVILGVVVINAIIGFIQEGKAENALKAISQMLSPNATVIRETRQVTIRAEDLVPGDIVLLQSGDKVAADLRLFQLKGLQIQESALTGESVAVEKVIDPVLQESVIGDRHCMAFSGTLVTHGQGKGVVVATGAQTELGHISKLVSEVKSETTPLLRQIADFGRWLTISIAVISAATFAFGVWVREYAVAEMFLASVSLAVAAIPEGLPAIMTITLAIGVQRMARHNAIIRKLPAVETLGAVSVICTDKTGTLTRNEMTVRKIATSGGLFELTGTGYDPDGTISLENNSLKKKSQDTKQINPEENPILIEILQAALLCNDASLELNEKTGNNQSNKQYLVNGDPMEGALLVAGLKASLDLETVVKKYSRIDLIPFESEHRFMATLHHSHTDDAFIYLKGAPERVLEMCVNQRCIGNDQILSNEPLESSYWLEQIDQMAQQGQRVLAIAVKTTNSSHPDLKFSDVENGMTMLGLFGFIDPPREEAIKAVEDCVNAGIRVKMITGDHGATARAIAHQLKFINSTDVLTGQELEKMSEDTLRTRVLDVDIYARVSPEHKLRLVNVLQDQDLIVAMTGDGVNDAPALKRADVGIAMGRNGTEAAKEAAEMVLADDNFATIVQSVKEGRTVYANLQKAFLFMLPNNGGEALVLIAAILFGFQYLPLTPVQILWVNMVTAVALELALAFEPPERDIMMRRPRHANMPILTPYLIWRIVFVSLIMMAGTMGLFVWGMEQGESVEYARTVAVNTLVIFQIFYLFNSRYMTASIFNWEGFTGNRYVLYAIGILVLFQLGFTYMPFMQILFGTVAINFNSWKYIVLVASSVLFLVELEKLIVRNMSLPKPGIQSGT